MFHFHKWSKWTLQEATFGNIFGKKWDETVQVRECTTCGKTQWEEI